jgi:PleD family two-component response regulator
VSVESTIGKGSTFAVRIPIHVPEHLHVSEPSPRLLVVDDRPASLYSTTRILRAGGFTVLQATTGTEAVAVATSQPIDSHRARTSTSRT